MELHPKRPSTKGPPDRFLGEVWFDVIVDDRVTARLRAAVAHFAPGARNAWHFHAMGQTLHILEGVGRTQARGGKVIEVHAGDTIHTQPGEWHWHGAAPDHLMSHLTLYEAPDDGPDTEWGDHVTDDEYAGSS